MENRSCGERLFHHVKDTNQSLFPLYQIRYTFDPSDKATWVQFENAKLNLLVLVTFVN